MSLEVFILGGYGQFVWPAFIFTCLSCTILYLKTNKELHLRILEDNQFQNVNYYIKYLEQELI